MSNFVVQVAKKGKDIRTATPFDFVVNSNTPTMKIAYSGTLEVDMPNEIINDSVESRTAQFNHDFGGAVMFVPMITGGVFLGDLANDGDYLVNDLVSINIPPAGYGPGTAGEWIFLKSSETAFILEVRRYNFIPFDQSFGARTATLNFTLLYNRIN